LPTDRETWLASRKIMWGIGWEAASRWLVPISSHLMLSWAAHDSGRSGYLVS
jgi:hypothetical protein